MRPLHIGDDILGYPNGVIPTPFLLPNLVSNHLAIGFLLDHIGGAIALVPPVGLGVDERTVAEPPKLIRLKCAKHHPKSNAGYHALQTE